jgi:hypothetical protein
MTEAENGISQLLENRVLKFRMLLNKEEIKSDNIDVDTGHCNERGTSTTTFHI